MEHDLIAGVIVKSFANWAKKDRAYSRLYKKLPEGTLKIAEDGFREINVHHPYQFDVWWLKNHMRYYRSYRQEDMKNLYQMVYTFLSIYSRGPIGKGVEDRTATKKNRKAKAS